jgi:K+/H+ antiporter YhaU regulatory subunit KhtT
MLEYITNNIETVNPSKLLVLSPPKIGKTTIVSMLPNCMILDFERGSKFVKGVDKINIHTMYEKWLEKNDKKTMIVFLAEIAKFINKKYDYVCIDTTSSLQEIARKYATTMYKASSQGKSFTGKDVVSELPNGAGYDWLRRAFGGIYSLFEHTPNKCIILLGHVKIKSLNKDGKDIDITDLDLVGKSKQMVTSEMDAIGILFRDKENNTCISFKKNETDMTCGARPSHLKEAEFVILENADGEFISHWDRIFV